MPPENLRFGGGVAETMLHPAVLVMMLVAVILVLVLPRRYIVVPLLLTIFWVPLGQQLVVGGLHFFVYRILLFAGFGRLLIAKLTSAEGVFNDRLNRLDGIFLLWAVFRVIAGILTFMQLGAVINQSAFFLDVIGGYFILRYAIRDWEDVYRTIKVLAVAAVVIAVSMTYEKFYVTNPFGLLGGVRMDPEVRLGAVRAQGPFQHELLAGTFGATLLPLFFLLWSGTKSKILAAVGLVSATLITFTSASSTPFLAYAAAVGAICLWPLRKHLRLLRWGAVGALVALQLVMKAPVWFLIRHVDVVGGSSGYHRAMLVNDFIVHFFDWWLIGTKDNAAWGFNMWDLCNQYVVEGQTGGLGAFICFVAIVCICFSRIGNARKAVDGDTKQEWLYWMLGCTLFSHVVAFFGISYFDQTRFLWFALLAIISAATAQFMTSKVTSPEEKFHISALHPAPVLSPALAWQSGSTASKTASVPVRTPKCLTFEPLVKSRLSNYRSEPN